MICMTYDMICMTYMNDMIRMMTYDIHKEIWTQDMSLLLCTHPAIIFFIWNKLFCIWSCSCINLYTVSLLKNPRPLLSMLRTVYCIEVGARARWLCETHERAERQNDRHINMIVNRPIITYWPVQPRRVVHRHRYHTSWRRQTNG